jgi:hypothetical protein
MNTPQCARQTKGSHDTLRQLGIATVTAYAIAIDNSKQAGLDKGHVGTEFPLRESIQWDLGINRFAQDEIVRGRNGSKGCRAHESTDDQAFEGFQALAETKFGIIDRMVVVGVWVCSGDNAVMARL